MTTIWKDQKPALLAMIFLAISLMLYPTVVLGGLDSILDWTGTGGPVPRSRKSRARSRATGPGAGRRPW